ncbi:plasmid replication, integration and excision activator [Streptosporangium sp. NPDC006007]|uniref:plasmid replication, integration and excision activator n=1 Tax=Streptosporangium sp. NPDC006007 TaxID=3154575 RepID=UPI0033B9F508
MAIQGPIPIGFDQVFPHGCYLVGDVQQVKDFDASTNGRTVYAKDKTTGLPVWQISVIDADPEAKASQKSVTVKILTELQPVPPPPLPDLPIPATASVGPVEIGRCEDGTSWRLKVHGTHVPVAGATGAGKGSVIWSTIRGPPPAPGWCRSGRWTPG